MYACCANWFVPYLEPYFILEDSVGICNRSDPTLYLPVYTADAENEKSREADLIPLFISFIKTYKTLRIIFVHRDGNKRIVLKLCVTQGQTQCNPLSHKKGVARRFHVCYSFSTLINLQFYPRILV